jgi:hypothetical protein
MKNRSGYPGRTDQKSIHLYGRKHQNAKSGSNAQGNIQFGMVVVGAKATGNLDPDFLAVYTGLPVEFVKDVLSVVNGISLWSDEERDNMLSLLEDQANQPFIEN